MRAGRVVLFLMLLAAAGLAQAAEFRSVGAAPAVLYDTPSEKGRKLFVAPRGMPVEVVLTYGDWIKVRDASGDMSWVAARALVPKRQVVVTAANARVHAAADESSAPVFGVERHVLLEMTEPLHSGWVRVRHADGSAGFIRASEVWGE